MMWPHNVAGESAGDDLEPRYVISVVARLTGLHPQTLRQYDRLEIVSPGRSAGRGRRYSQTDVMQLRRVQQLTAAGVNLEGVRQILALEQQLEVLRRQLRGHGLLPADEPYEPQDSHPHLPIRYTIPATALVRWRRVR